MKTVSELQTILAHSLQFTGRQFSETEIDCFSHYYQLVLKWNDHLHLTTLIEPTVFAERHIFEPSFAACYLLPSIHKVWDFGSGLGIPGIPISVIRPDLSVSLVEASQKKAVFLKEVRDALQLHNVTVLNQRFETMSEMEADSCVTVRAIEQMTKVIPQILNIQSYCTQFLLFGGSETKSAIIKSLPQDWKIEQYLIPLSQNRFLFSLHRST